MDYSPYKFNYFPKEPKKDRIHPAKKGKKDYVSPIIIGLILVTLIASLLLVGRVVGRDLIGETVTLISGKDTLAYYTVCLNPTDYRSDAEALSRKVRLSGGGGYIISYNNRYYVSLATYLTEESAKEVSSKNENTTYITFTFDRKSYLNNVTDDGISRRVLGAIEEGINGLDEAISLYEKKELSLVDTTHRIEKTKNEFLNLKIELLSARYSNRDELIKFITPFVNLLVEEERISANVRYAITETICCLGKID